MKGIKDRPQASKAPTGSARPERNESQNACLRLPVA